MTADLYGAWLEAGDNLQRYGAWIAAHWIWLTVAALVLGGGVAGRVRAGRSTRRGLARLEQYANHAASRPILDDFHQPRKEAQ